MREIGDKRKEIEANEQTASCSQAGPLIRCLQHICAIPWVKKWGEGNAQRLVVEELCFSFQNLPDEFSGYKILFLADFHIKVGDSLPERIHHALEGLDYDLCLLGGGLYLQTWRNAPRHVSGGGVAGSRPCA